MSAIESRAVGMDGVRVASPAAVAAGGVCWAGGVAQYAVAQLVAAAWARPYSLKSNYISDLGITACGLFHVRHGTSYYVCSPGHGLANASFVIFGALRIAGAVLLRGIRPAGHLARRALILWTLSGPGKVIIGLVPESSRSWQGFTVDARPQ